MPPAICPHCGIRVPAKARACPECGADDSTGWSELARTDELDVPEENFDYEHFTKQEFDGGAPKSPGMHWFWWLVALLLIVSLLRFCWP